MDIFLESGKWADCFDTFAGKIRRLVNFKIHHFLADQSINPWRYFGTSRYPSCYDSIVFEYLVTGVGRCPMPPVDDRIARYYADKSPWLKLGWMSQSRNTPSHALRIDPYSYTDNIEH